MIWKPSSEPDSIWDCVIIGGALVGSLAACFLAAQGFRVLILERHFPSLEDPRSLVLSAATKSILTHYGLWTDELPIRNIQKVCLTTRQGIPKVNLQHPYQPDGILGYVVPYSRLMPYLQDALKGNVTFRCPAEITQQTPIPGGWRLTINEADTVDTRLVIAADGAHSAWRRACGIGFLEEDFQQTAYVFEVGVPAAATTAYEFFSSEGILALVPRSNTQFGAIWMQSQGKEIPPDLDAWLAHIQSVVGSQIHFTQLLSVPHSFPLIGQKASLRMARRSVLVGNAARTLHPIAAQGLNSHILELHYLAQNLARAKKSASDFSEGRVLSAWAQQCQIKGERIETLTRLAGKMLAKPYFKHLHTLGLTALSFSTAAQEKLVSLGLAQEWLDRAEKIRNEVN